MNKFNKIVDGIYMLHVPFCGIWTGVALVTGKQNYLIDSGALSSDVDEHIIPALADMGLGISDIDCLLNTHTHGDHVGGHFRLRELGIKKVATYYGSVDKVRDPLKYNIEIRKAFPKNSPPPSSTLKGIDVDEILYDGQQIGERLVLIHTPGHDDDTCCFYDKQTKSIITGDSLQLHGTATQGCGFYQYLNEYRASLDRLLRMDIENVIAGHPYLTLGDVALGYDNAKKYLTTCLSLTYEYRDFIKGLYDAGERDYVTMAKKLIAHVGGTEPGFLFLPLYTVREHVKEIS